MKDLVNEVEDLEWVIHLLREENKSLRKLNQAILRSKTIATIITKEGKNFRRLRVLESHETLDGITLLVSK
jgi:hypothetical protein